MVGRVGRQREQREGFCGWRPASLKRHLVLPPAICLDVVVNKQGGRLFLDDQPGPGARFVLRLPIVGEATVVAITLASRFQRCLWGRYEGPMIRKRSNIVSLRRCIAYVNLR